jgi:hypothetical protein
MYVELITAGSDEQLNRGSQHNPQVREIITPSELY